MTKVRLLGDRILEFYKKHPNFIQYAFFFIIFTYLIGFIYSIIFVIFFFFENLYLLCNAVLYSPNYPPGSRKNVDTPDKYNFKDYECSFFKTSDKKTLHYIFLRKEKLEERSKVPTIVYLHGNAGNIGHRLENTIEMFEILNVNIFMPEYRGYGLSSGHPTEKGLYLDAISSLEFLYKCKDINHNMIVLFGRSLGGAVAIGTTSLILKNPLQHSLLPRALIVENTFTSVPDIAKKVSHDQMNNFISKLIRFLPLWFYGSLFDSLEKVKSIDIPILFLSGLKDELLPVSMMEELFNSAKSSSKRIEHFMNGTHNFTWKCPNYYSTMQNFLVQLINGDLITNTIQNNDIDCVSIPISDLERSPLIINEETK